MNHKIKQKHLQKLFQHDKRCVSHMRESHFYSAAWNRLRLYYIVSFAKNLTDERLESKSKADKSGQISIWSAKGRSISICITITITIQCAYHSVFLQLHHHHTLVVHSLSFFSICTHSSDATKLVFILPFSMCSFLLLT